MIYITWSDRRSVIRTGASTSSTTVLTSSRFSSSCKGSIWRVGESPNLRDRTSADRGPTPNYTSWKPPSSKANQPIFFPIVILSSGINLVGRSTGAARATDAGGEVPLASEKIRNGNDMIAKFSWPEETRASEAEVVEEAIRISDKRFSVRRRPAHGLFEPSLSTAWKSSGIRMKNTC